MNDDQISMNGDKGGVPERAAGESNSQLGVETAHDVAGAPASPDVRINDHEDNEEQCAQVINAQTNNEDAVAPNSRKPFRLLIAIQKFQRSLHNFTHRPR